MLYVCNEHFLKFNQNLNIPYFLNGLWILIEWSINIQRIIVGESIKGTHIQKFLQKNQLVSVQNTDFFYAFTYLIFRLFLFQKRLITSVHPYRHLVKTDWRVCPRVLKLFLTSVKTKTGSNRDLIWDFLVVKRCLSSSVQELIDYVLRRFGHESNDDCIGTWHDLSWLLVYLYLYLSQKLSLTIDVAVW